LYLQVKIEKDVEIRPENIPEKVFNAILRHCDGNTMLSLSLTCKDIRKLVLESDEFFKKIQLTIDCSNFHGLNFLTLNCFAADMDFKSLKIIHLQEAFTNIEIKQAFQWLVRRLGKTVEEFKIEKSNISGDQLNEIFQKLSNLKTISLVKAKIQPKANQKAMLSMLNNLSAEKSYGISFFDIIQLTKLGYRCFTKTSLKAELKIFLQSQKNLKVLNTDVSIFKSPEVLPIQLNDFTLTQTREQSVDLVRLNEFLMTQKTLKFLRFFINKESLLDPEPLLRVLSTICLINLQELEISLRDIPIQQTNETFLKLNRTLQKLTVNQKFCKLSIVSALVNVFENLREVNLKLAEPRSLKIFDKFSIKLETIGIIKLDEGLLETFNYSTEAAPTDQKAFEENIGNFLKHNGKNLREVLIGHSNWDSKENSFRLSQTFCEKLIDNLPKLEKLELFAVDRIFKPFAAFIENQDNDTLETVKLHRKRSNENEGKPAKRLKLELFS
jgi:hypothetical protein